MAEIGWYKPDDTGVIVQPGWLEKREEPVETTPVVTVVGADVGLVVGPDDVLVMTFTQHTADWELKDLRRQLLEAGLRPDQFVLVSAGWNVNMAKVARERLAIDPGE